MRSGLFYALLGIAFVACLLGWVGPATLLVGGILVSLLVGNPIAKRTGLWGKYLLQASVVLMGFKYDFRQVLSIGGESIWVSMLTILMILGVSVLVGRWLKLRYEPATLIACGTCICGGSAIAAVSGVIRAEDKDIAVSLGTIFLLNAVALVIFPLLGHWMGMSEVAFGYWSGIAIQDTSSVAGAAQSYGAEALAWAIPVKLSRALWIIPLCLFVGWRYKKHCVQQGIEQGGRFSFPWFIAYFALASVAKTWVPQGETLYGMLSLVGGIVLTFTLYLIGLGLSRHALKVVGWRALLLGVILWIVLSSSSFLWLSLGGRL